ncbi:MAG: VTT domain-containing protein [Candidatus Acidiferrales bacterium]
MDEQLDFLVRHGYSLLFAWVFLEQLGLPIPSVPLLLAAGALAGAGKMSLSLAVAIPSLAAVASDIAWFETGRRRGTRVLQWLCKISLEPDSCVRRTQDTFKRYGAKSLVVAKFIPGLNTVAPPLAGMGRIGWAQFLAYDGLGAIVWSATAVLIGFAFSSQIERVAHHAAALGVGLFLLLAVAFGSYIGWKIANRRRFLRKLRIARISPQELKSRMDGGEDVLVVDLRGAMEFEAEPDGIPGAVRLDTTDVSEAEPLFPRDREVVLYCSCPNEETSARMALFLKRRGVERIRPLAGGLVGWSEQGYPLEPMSPASIGAEGETQAEESA